MKLMGRGGILAKTNVPWGEGRGCLKTNKGDQGGTGGGGGSKHGNPERKYFLNVSKKV